MDHSSDQGIIDGVDEKGNACRHDDSAGDELPFRPPPGCISTKRSMVSSLRELETRDFR